MHSMHARLGWHLQSPQLTAIEMATPSHADATNNAFLATVRAMQLPVGKVNKLLLAAGTQALRRHQLRCSPLLSETITACLQNRTDAIAFARSQVDYALGAHGRSYVVGFGKNWPQQVSAKVGEQA